MSRRPSPKLRRTAIPSRAELAAALAAAGLFASGSADARPEDDPSIYVYVPTEDEGRLIVAGLPREVWVFLDEQLVPREQWPLGVALSAGSHALRFHWACGQDVLETVTIAAGGETRIDAAAVLRPPDRAPLGGVPVHYDSGLASCSIDSPAPTGAGADAAMTALGLIAALAALRRRARA